MRIANVARACYGSEFLELNLNLDGAGFYPTAGGSFRMELIFWVGFSADWMREVPRRSAWASGCPGITPT